MLRSCESVRQATGAAAAALRTSRAGQQPHGVRGAERGACAVSAAPSSCTRQLPHLRMHACGGFTHRAPDLAGAQVVGDMLVYPNRMTFDIMPNGGNPPDPKGVLVLRIKSVSDIHGKGDLFSKVPPPPPPALHAWGMVQWYMRYNLL